MARIETDPNYTAPTFSGDGGDGPIQEGGRAGVAAALSTHTHATGKGAVLVAAAIRTGSITSAMIADLTIVGGDIANRHDQVARAARRLARSSDWQTCSRTR